MIMSERTASRFMGFGVGFGNTTLIPGVDLQDDAFAEVTGARGDVPLHTDPRLFSKPTNLPTIPASVLSAATAAMKAAMRSQLPARAANATKAAQAMADTAQALSTERLAGPGVVGDAALNNRYVATANTLIQQLKDFVASDAPLAQADAAAQAAVDAGPSLPGDITSPVDLSKLGTGGSSDTTIFGLPKAAVYAGGAVAGLALLYFLATALMKPQRKKAYAGYGRRGRR